MKKIVIFLIIIIVFVVLCYMYSRLGSNLFVIDSFEGQIIGGDNATVDYGSGSGATVFVSGVKYPVKHGSQAIKIVYDATSGGYMWIARGYNLSQENAGQWTVRPEKIKWENYDAIAFDLYGEASGNEIAVDLVDNCKEYWRATIKDDTRGWKGVVIPFSDFLPRTDWQPDNAIRNNMIDYPVMVFRFEPLEGSGTIYVDKVCLRKRGK